MDPEESSHVYDVKGLMIPSDKGTRIKETFREDLRRLRGAEAARTHQAPSGLCKFLRLHHRLLGARG